MRPGQNKRMRGRNNNNNNNNRKGPNPLTRSYESNGPDVKIRGTAHHIAEKYLQLARDAQTSGDPVAAESYLQHAEHYFRLIASAQQAQMGFNRPADEPDPDETDDDDVNAVPDRFASPPERPQPQLNPPQPYADRPYNGGERQGGFNGERPAYNGERPAFNGERHDRQDRGQQDRQGQDRGNYEGGRRNDRMGRGPRPYREQDGRPDQRGQDNRNQEYRGQERGYSDRQPESRPDVREGGRPDQQGGRTFSGPPRDRLRDAAVGEAQPEVNLREDPVQREPDVRPAEAPDLPAFIRAPVRLGQGPSETTEMPDALPAGTMETAAEGQGDEAPRFPPRRRRRPRVAAPGADEAPAEAPIPEE